jgi:hypothetical protein
MTDFPPNPLVTALAQKLLAKDAQTYLAAQQTATDAEWLASSQATPEHREAATQARTAEGDEALDLATKLAANPAIPPLVTFAGFLGGTVSSEDGKKTWRVFYLDAKLLTWLLFDEDAILYSQRLKDETAPFGERDVIWLRSSTSVTEGTGPPRPNEIEAELLRGDFIGAGDFSASLTGGTFSRATGLLCEVQTPGCCGRRTQ